VKKQSDSVITILSLLSLVGFSSCGNILKANVPTYSNGAGGRSSNLALGATAKMGDFACPATPNILPDKDVNLDGTDIFTACTSPTRTFDLQITGRTESSSQICVFPVTFIDNIHIYYKPEVSTGAPLVQCVDATSGSMNTSFLNVNYNAVFIVEAQSKQQLIQCLVTGNFFTCPHYSFGKIK